MPASSTAPLRLLRICALVFLTACFPVSLVAETDYPTLPDPTADDGVCRILVLGHSFFVGDDDLVGMLPEMLAHQMGWEVELEFILTQAAPPARASLVEDGLLSKEAADLKGAEKIWRRIKDTLAAADYDLIFFLDGTGSPHVAAKYEGYGMLHYRIFADALLRQEPGAHVLGLAVWPPPTFDFLQYAEDSDLNLAAWRGAAGAESEAQRIFDLKVQDKEQVQPVYGVLKNRWDELGNLHRFVAAPVAEAWKIAYAEKGIGNIILHRGIEEPDSHGNLWGDYLKTCVFFSMITGEPFRGEGYTGDLVSPGHSKAPPHENKTNLPDDVARYLEDVAWRTVLREREAMRNLLNGRPAGVEPIAYSGEPATLLIRRTLDERGFERLREYLSPAGEISSRVLFEHDDQGTLTRQALLTPGDDVIQEQFYEAVYEDGNLREHTHRDSHGRLVGKTLFDYDDQGNLIREKQEDRKGNVDATYEMDYEEGRLTERRFFNAAGKRETTTRYAYDGHGRLEQEVEKDSRGRVNLTVTYTYPDDSPDARPATILRDRGSSSRILREFEYAPDGRPTLEELYRLPDDGERVMLRTTRYE
ncbi:MAG: hypothetical protein ACLFSZ_08550 [Puniceicoccaceae bacterium]